MFKGYIRCSCGKLRPVYTESQTIKCLCGRDLRVCMVCNVKPPYKTCQKCAQQSKFTPKDLKQ